MTTVTFAEAPALVRSFRKPQSPDQTLGGGGDSPVFKEVERGGSPAKTVKPVKRKGSTKRKSWQPTAAHTPERSAEDPSAADGPAEADGRAGGAGSDWMLFEATEFSLVKKRHGQLSKMCEDRGLLVQVSALFLQLALPDEEVLTANDSFTNQGRDRPNETRHDHALASMERQQDDAPVVAKSAKPPKALA